MAHLDEKESNHDFHIQLQHPPRNVLHARLRDVRSHRQPKSPTVDVRWRRYQSSIYREVEDYASLEERYIPEAGLTVPLQLRNFHITRHIPLIVIDAPFSSELDFSSRLSSIASNLPSNHRLREFAETRIKTRRPPCTLNAMCNSIPFTLDEPYLPIRPLCHSRTSPEKQTKRQTANN